MTLHNHYSQEKKSLTWFRDFSGRNGSDTASLEKKDLRESCFAAQSSLSAISSRTAFEFPFSINSTTPSDQQ